MYVKKEFALYEFLEEDAYLMQMAKEGHCLDQALGDGFEFKDCEPSDVVYRVVYSLNDFNQGDYEGFSLVFTYASSKGGYYHYLIEEAKEAVLLQNADRKYRLENDLGRIERFSGIVISSLMVLFLYLAYTQRKPLYLLIVFMGMGLGVFVLKLRAKIKKAIEQ